MRFPAKLKKQLWVRDNATDVGEPEVFDAHDAMISLPASDFNRVANEIMSGASRDLDDLALNAGVVQKWLEGSPEATFTVVVDESDFTKWLTQIGLAVEEATTIDEEQLDEIRREHSVIRESAPAF